MFTPWGKAESIEAVAEGLIKVTTPGHGGIILNEQRTAAMPAYMRDASSAGPSAYEEDCDWSMAALVFAKEFQAFYERQGRKDIDAIFTYAKDMLRDFHPGVYEAFFGLTLTPRESLRRNEEQFYRDNKDNWLTIAAWGDWHPNVPAGMVAVTATLGCVRASTHKRRYFLVPALEYSAYPSEPKHRFAFVADPLRHQEIPPIEDQVTKRRADFCRPCRYRGPRVRNRIPSPYSRVPPWAG